MIGAIIGDVIGSPYEGRRMKFFDYDFPLFNEKSTFTDDTVLTVGTAKAILENTSYKDNYLEMGRQYKNKGYGSAFQAWLYSDDPQPYDSWGNGSAMRVSPVGLYFDDQKQILKEAKASSEVTHNHIYAIEGSQVIALAIHEAKRGQSKEQIKQLVLTLAIDSNYDLSKDVSFYRNNYRFDITCKGTVPQALIAFFESTDFESCIRNAVLMGGDTDTLACIAGSLAEAYYKYIPEDIAMKALQVIPSEFLAVVREFYKTMKVKI